MATFSKMERYPAKHRQLFAFKRKIKVKYVTWMGFESKKVECFCLGYVVSVSRTGRVIAYSTGRCIPHLNIPHMNQLKPVLLLPNRWANGLTWASWCVLPAPRYFVNLSILKEWVNQFET
jgi:hypothetical protein